MDAPMTPMPASPFISNSTVSPRAVGSAVALSRTSALDAQADAAAGTIQSSDGGVDGHPPQATGEAESADVRQTAGIEPGPSEAIPASTGGPQETPASAPSKNPDVGVLDAIDCIHEIFHYARKLMRGHQGFVLDEAEFLADVEEEPLFIRDGEHLRRWEA